MIDSFISSSVQLLSIIKLLFPDNRARVAVVSYKDHNLGPDVCIQSVPFTATEDELLR